MNPKPKSPRGALRWDSRSDWALSPRGTWENGQGQLVRVFDDPQSALEFIGPRARRQARQNRYIERRRQGQACVQLAVDCETVDLLVTAGYLGDSEAFDWQRVAAALALMISDWKGRWLRNNYDASLK
jgi:hypothetical protein